jgi:penicillin amidase
VDSALLAGARIPELARALLEQASAVHASNAWVVGGARTRSGKPIVANDMHLGLDVPSIWYLVGLHAPGLDVVGVSIAGSPGVIAGRSGAVAWGFTNAMVDDADLFVERVDSADPSRYLTPEGPQPFTVRQEQIAVRGVDQPVSLTVRETRHGPVISDVDVRAGEDVLALRWVGLDPSPTAEAIMRMDGARSAAEFIDALRLFRDPHQNVVFADTAGAWGYWMAGRVPLRRRGRPPLLPVAGWTDEHDWVGDLPFEDHPHVLEPARGFVVTANNRQTAGPVGDLIGNDFEAPYRAERITALLDSAGPLDAAAVARQQMDVVSLFALKHRQVAVDAFKQSGDTARADSLAAWDGSMGADRREPLLFWQWIEIVRFHVGRDLYAGAPAYFPMSVLDRMLDQGRVGAAITTSVVKEAVADASRYRWGDMHPLHLDHPMQSLKVVGSVLGFGHEPVPVGGDPYTVNAAGHSGRTVPFVVKHGPSERFVVDLGAPTTGGFILPGGESGFPRNAHAFDQLDAWLEGRLAPMPLDRPSVEAAGVSILRLVPTS